MFYYGLLWQRCRFLIILRKVLTVQYQADRIMPFPPGRYYKYGKGKYLLRHAFEGAGYLSNEILWREKAAFSDAVGHSMVDYLKEYAEQVLGGLRRKPSFRTCSFKLRR